jgi:glycosyltransferase involved in cell wall biosynthesis
MPIFSLAPFSNQGMNDSKEHVPDPQACVADAPAANTDCSPLSIGYWSPGWPPDAFANGIVSYVADISTELNKMGHRLTVIAAAVAPSAGTYGDDVYYPQPSQRPPGLGRRLMDAMAYRIAPKWTTDRIHSRIFLEPLKRAISGRGIQVLEMEESFGVSLLAQRALRVPVCVRLHGPWFLNGTAEGAADDRAFRERVRAEGRGIAAADAITSSSRDVLERTRAYYDLPLDHAEVIYPVTSPVAPSERWQRENCNPEQVLFVGRFDRHKGGDIVIEAFGRVLRHFPRAELVFVGRDCGYTDANGRSWSLDGFIRDRLPGALESGRIRVLGQQPLSSLTEFRRKAMVTVVCSRYENAPRVLLEAMSVGCPIVAARVGGIPEILLDQRDGLLHAPGDANDLAARILELLRDPDRAAALGQNAAKTWLLHFQPEVIAARTADFYSRLLGRRPLTGRHQHRKRALRPV